MVGRVAILVAVSLASTAGATAGDKKSQARQNTSEQVRATDRDCMRWNLSDDDYDWALWLDEQDHSKLIRVAIPADNAEVLGIRR